MPLDTVWLEDLEDLDPQTSTCMAYSGEMNSSRR